MGLLKKKIEIKLVKSGEKDVIINCPESIKLGLLDLYMALRLDIPPLNIKPINYVSIVINLLLYALIYAVPALLLYFGTSTAVFLILTSITIALNIVVNKNYYWNFICKKLKEGYLPANEETRAILESVKILEL